LNIQAEKPEIMKLILETDNPGLLVSIRELFNKKVQPDFWETIPQNQKDDILGGMKEIEDGDVVDYEEYIKKHR